LIIIDEDNFKYRQIDPKHPNVSGENVGMCCEKDKRFVNDW